MPRIDSTSSLLGTRPTSLRRRLVALLASATLVAAIPLATNATTAAGGGGGHKHDKGHSTQWVGTWASVPTEVPVTGVQTFEDQTIRQVVHTSIGGDSLRLRLTNEFGDEPLAVGHVHVARRAGASGTDIDPATDHVVTFSGQSSVIIPAGSPMVSDPVHLRLPPRSDLVVSVYLPEPTRATTLHAFAYQENEIAAGNVTGHASITGTATITQWLFLSNVSVETRKHGAAAVVTLGDSITNGFETQVNANHRYPDFLARQFATRPWTRDLGVLNLGVAGNRLLHDPNPPEGHSAEGYAAFFGDSALRRFDRDVVAQPGAKYVIVLLGVNDLGHPGTSAPLSEEVTAEEIIAAHRQLIARAHVHGMKIFGGTILPFQGDTLGFWNEENEAKRQQVNEWIRTSEEYDAVIDFDAALRDPANPLRLAPAYDSGDGLHPNDAGMLALARAVPLKLFR